jgi:acyl-CoA thioesterase
MLTMERIKHFFKKDRFAAHAGIELVSVTPGQAVSRMHLQPEHLNGMGTAHGGALFTLADFTFAAACNSHGTVAVAISASINFIKAATEGWLKAEARELSKNARLGTYTVEVTDEQGELVAIFQGLAYRKKDAINFA